MAGNWTERDDLEFGWGARPRGGGQGEGPGGREPRSFERGDPPGRYSAPHGYTGPGPSGGYSRGEPARGEWLAAQDYTQRGQAYADDSADARSPNPYGYRDRAEGQGSRRYEAGGYSPSRASYHARGYGEPGFDTAGNAPRTERTERFEDAGRNAGDFLHRAGEKMASWFGASSDGYERQARDHRGRGPKAYRRSDERISEDVHERLTEDRWLDASEITVAVLSGEVTLSGAVEDRDAKHRAERIVEDVSGVRHVQNNLRVGEGSFVTPPQSTDEAVAGGTGGAGAGQSTAGRKI